MTRKQKGRKPEYIVFNKRTDEVKETVTSTYAAKRSTLFHNNMAYTQMKGTPYGWKKVLLQ